MGDELVLLNYHPSPFATRVRIALAEKGLKYEAKDEDLLGSKTGLLLKMNPIHKQIPVLIHNGKPICESMIIVQYIDEQWNNKSPLLPTDPYQRAHARFWVDHFDNKIFPIAAKLWTTKGETKEAAKKDLIEGLKVLEKELGDKPYFGGESLGYIDLGLIPFYTFFHTFESLGNFSMAKECPKLVEWGKKCSQKETVSKSLCDHNKVYEIILEFRKRLGAEE
ncbi:probable glutathione S-transferase [Ricinus communis]|uniref:probable glutathione S-transferase n=1 Tax=Ricinus communis TaxID=3988 RepID=UPI0007724403|nr:probable glutathione S-transferase [Ricinus communis]|eukprot:XP_015572818.1 probable glutathione S-transferase [Ricinus communis]